MRWILGSIASLIVLAALAALVAPRLIDWNAYRPRIAEALAQRTGLQAEIAGDLHLVLLPTPTLFAAGVRLAPPGRADRPLAVVEGLRAELAPLDLLLGAVEPRAIALDAPELTLRLQDGGPAEAVTLARQLLSVGTAGQAPGLRGLSIRNGRLVVLRGGERVAAFAGIEVEFAAPGSERPGHLQVDARWDEVPLSLSVDIGALPPSGATTLRGRIDLAGGLAQAGYGGTLTLGDGGSAGSAAGPAVATEGQFNATVRDPAALLTLLGLPGASAQGLPREQLALSARMIAEPGTLVVNDLDLRWGRATAGGAAAAILGPPLDLNLTLHVAGLELDGLAGLLPLLVPDRSDGLVLPEVGRITFDVTATALRSHGSVVRRVQLAGVLDQGSLDLQDLHADLPGSASVSLQGRLVAPGTLPEFTGRLALEAADARRTLLWLGLAEGDLPPAAPRRLRAEASLALDAGLWRIVDLAAEVDGATLHGGIALRPSGRPSFSANLRLADLTLDPWIPALSAALDGQLARIPLPAGAVRSAGDWLADLGGLLAGFDSNLRLGLRNLTWNKRALSEAHLDLGLVKGALSLNRAALAFADGVAVDLTGTASADAGPGRLDYDLSLSAEGRQLLDRLRQLAPVLLPGGGAGREAANAGATQPGLAPPPAAIPSGPSRLSLQLSGDTGQALVRELELAMPGAELKARGTLGLAAPVPTLVADLTWRIPDPARFRDHVSGIVDLPDSGLSWQPSQGSAALAVDAGTVSVGNLSLSLPGLAVTGEGRVSRTARPLSFDLALAAQASSLRTMLSTIAPGRQGAAVAVEPMTGDRPVALILRAAGTPAAVSLQEARLAYGRTELRLDGGGRLQPEPALEGGVHLTAPDLAGLATDAGMPPAAGGAPLGPVELAGRYALDGSALRVEEVEGMAGPAALSAAFDLTWDAERPLLRADLGLSSLPLDRLLPDDLNSLWVSILAEPDDAALLSRPGDSAAAGLPAMPSALLQDMAYDISVAAEGIDAAGGLLSEGRFEAQLHDRELTVSVIEARLAGGRLAGTATLDARGLPALSLTADLQGLDAPTLFADAQGLDGLAGRVDATFRLRTAGRTPAAMLERLSGQAEVAVAAGSFAGLDLAALAAEAMRDPPVATSPEALRAALLPADGDTPFRDLSGQLFLESGVLRLQQVQAGLAMGNAAWHGSVSLPARELDLTGTFRLDGLPDAPAVEVEIDGPFGDLRRHALVDAMAQYLAGRATAARLAPPSPEMPPEDAALARPAMPEPPVPDSAASGPAAPDFAVPGSTAPGPAGRGAVAPAPSPEAPE